VRRPLVPGLAHAPGNHVRRSTFYLRFGKRLFDLTLALLGLALLLLPMGCIASGIIIFDGLPVLFRQIRVGRNGYPFTILKFRTMYVSAKPGTSVTVAHDRRITRVGKFLRRFKLDELPQLLNVLKGDMSFVGPRPDVPGYMDNLQGDAVSLLQVRPGITGPATLAFRNEEQILAAVDDPSGYNDQVIFPEKIRLNLLYLEEASFLFDLRCILQTLSPGDTEPDQNAKLQA
jgi:lipopolysaccharide/colanic/teichoic acid biosynthesis glycosyltransferase